MMTRSPILLVPGALVLAACAAAGAGALPRAHGAPPPAVQMPGAPMTEGRTPADRCTLTVLPGGPDIVIRGAVAAGAPLSGDYRLTIAGRGNSIDQAGDFALAAGRAATLAELRLSGRASDYDMRLVLRVAGDTIACGVVAP